jgi:hypothetical protein
LGDHHFQWIPVEKKAWRAGKRSTNRLEIEKMPEIELYKKMLFLARSSLSQHTDQRVKPLTHLLLRNIRSTETGFQYAIDGTRFRNDNVLRQAGEHLRHHGRPAPGHMEDESGRLQAQNSLSHVIEKINRGSMSE